MPSTISPRIQPGAPSEAWIIPSADPEKQRDDDDENESWQELIQRLQATASHSSSANNEHRQAFDQIQRKLFSVQKQKDDTDNDDDTTTNTMQQWVALQLLFYTNTTSTTSTGIDPASFWQTLVSWAAQQQQHNQDPATQMMTTIVQTLVDISLQALQMLQAQTIPRSPALSNTLQLLQELVCPSHDSVLPKELRKLHQQQPSSTNHDEHGDNIWNHDSLSSPWVWMQLCQTIVATEDQSSNNDGTQEHEQLSSSLSQLKAVAQQLLRLPRQVANACWKQRSRKVPLQWTEARFSQALLQEATRSMFQEEQEATLAAAKENSNHDGSKLLRRTRLRALWWWTCLIDQIMLQQTSGADSVAYSLWKLVSSQNNKSQDNFDTPSSRIIWEKAVEHLGRVLSERSLARLGQSFVLLSLAKNSPAHDDKDEWLQEIILPCIIGSSRGVADELIRRLILSGPTGVSSKFGSTKDQGTVAPLSLQDCLVNLLSRMTTALPGNNENNDSEEGDSDSDDDDSIDSTTKELLSHPIYRQLHRVARVWSSITFVRQSDVREQVHVGVFLQRGLMKWKETNHESPLDPMSPMASCLLGGVSYRLESTITPVRLDGMRVAKALAQCLGQDLEFEELNQADGTRPSSNDTKSNHSEPNIVLNTEEVGQETNNQSDDDEDSLWNDDSVIAPLDLTDDQEDLRETPRPLFLRDCLQLLRTSETEETAYSNHETALQELPQLVRSRPLDLHDIAMDIAAEILHMENKFDMPEFAKMKMSGLLSLIVMEPRSVGFGLITEVFGSCSLMTRLHVLSTLSQGAWELAGLKALESSDDTNSDISHQSNLIADGRVHGRHAIVQESANSNDEELQVVVAQNVDKALTDRTRRWGKGRLHTSSSSASVVNQFTPMAPSWFYSLLGHFIERRADPALWDGTIGSTFLAQLLLTLANVVEMSGYSSSTGNMAKDLFQLVWGFRQAEIAEVRVAALCGVATALGSSLHSRTMLMQILADSSGADGLQRGLAEIATSDPDGKCRQLAVGIATQVQQAAVRSESAGFLDF